ncbi:MAG: DASS family sodium-coupled anion symporter [Pseudomonadota bacterium]
MSEPPHEKAKSTPQLIGLVLGPALFFGVLMLPTPATLSLEAWVVVALLLLMAAWWVTEAIPIPITSLLPLVVLPGFGVMPMADASASYFHPVVVLLFGGFLAATAVERWRLHERLALLTIIRAGSGRKSLIAGFLVASALLSAWISNTATSIMLMPVALSVAYELNAKRGERSPLTIAIVLAVAYGASIGGLATPIGTPTNLIVMGALEDIGDERLSFARWMMIGVPTVALMIPATWFVLTRGLPPAASTEGAPQEIIRHRLQALGPWSTPEIRTLFVFGTMAFFWVFRRAFLQDLAVFGVQPFAHVTDAMIAIAGSIAMFLVPSGCSQRLGSMLLNWETAVRIPWGVLLLFGGGLSVASAVTATGLGPWLGDQMTGLSPLSPVLIIVILTSFMIIFTEFTSNVAAAATLMPVIIAMGAGAGIDAAQLAIPVALAASCAFMFPMATAPNAIAYGTGEISIASMARIGFGVNALGIVIITLLAWLLTPAILG